MTKEEYQAIMQMLRKIEKWLELIYNLFAKYDSMALLELEDLRTEEIKKGK